MNTLDLAKKSRGTNLHFIKVFAYTLVAHAHIRLDACLRCESLSSTLPIQLQVHLNKLECRGKVHLFQ